MVCVFSTVLYICMLKLLGTLKAAPIKVSGPTDKAPGGRNSYVNVVTGAPDARSKQKVDGGLWVLLDFSSIKTRDLFLQHSGIKSWFSMLKVWHNDFAVKERLLWIEVEGVPLCAWNQSTFKKITSRWGDLIFLDDADESNRFSMRLGIKITHAPLVFESIVVDLSGVDHCIRVRELSSWTSNFLSGFKDEEGKIMLMITTVDLIRRGGSSNMKPQNTNTEDEEGDIDKPKGDGEAPSKDMGDVDVIHTIHVHVDCEHNIRTVTRRWDAAIILMGDFNEVREQAERFGSVFHQRQADYFNDFISDAELIDIPLGGYSFTWTDKVASKMSKLDIFLVSESFLDVFHGVVTVILEKFLLDHKRILLKEKKLQNLKCVLRKWNTSNRSNLNVARIKHMDRVAAIDVIADQGLASKDDLVIHNESLKILSNLDRLEAKDLAQKAKVKWAVEEVPFSREEIKRAVWDCGGDRAPGPNGFTLLSLRCNPPFIALIPKVSIRSEQSAFIKGRNILDNPLILNEVMEWYRLRKRRLIIFKVDFKKAYDSLIWEFLDSVMAELRFGFKWRRWIEGCFLNARASILKSKLLGVRVDHEESSELASILGCGVSMFPFTYLGVLVGSNMSRLANWKDVVDKRGIVSSSASSTWIAILMATKHLTEKGIDLLSMCKRKVTLSSYNDGWIWSHGGSDGFSVASARGLIDDVILDVDYVSTRWNRLVPAKVNVFFWRLNLNRIPTC
nr:RNA-directed DNA polymerase, eukaryota, reverse transcriptase zinc-binding domain protein [Tanacetum cinerariifolium]